MPSEVGHRLIDVEERDEALPDSEDALRELLAQVRERVRTTRDTPEMRRAQRIERRLGDFDELNSPVRHGWYDGMPWWPGYR